MEMIDHIVYVCPNLKQAKERFEHFLGIKIDDGGRHLSKGTCNAIFRIGKRAYFELLGPDPKADPEIVLNWLGTADLRSERISRWCVEPNDFQQDLSFLNGISKYNYQVYPGTRNKTNGEMLTWQLGLCESNPSTDVFPFLINWEKSIHPSINLKEHCNLRKIILYHSCPEKVQKICSHFKVDAEVIKSDTPKIKIELESPKGTVLIG